MSETYTNVLIKFRERETKGLLKYGTTMDRTDLSLQQWLTHLQEELMDATVYIEAALRELSNGEM
jgi:hypothetical protein